MDSVAVATAEYKLCAELFWQFDRGGEHDRFEREGNFNVKCLEENVKCMCKVCIPMRQRSALQLAHGAVHAVKSSTKTIQPLGHVMHRKAILKDFPFFFMTRRRKT